MVRGSEDLENFKLRAVAAAAGQTFVCVGGRSRQAEAAGVDESLIAWGWCAVDFLAHVTGFFTDDVVGCQKTGTLFSLYMGIWVIWVFGLYGYLGYLGFGLCGRDVAKSDS